MATQDDPTRGLDEGRQASNQPGQRTATEPERPMGQPAQHAGQQQRAGQQPSEQSQQQGGPGQAQQGEGAGQQGGMQGAGQQGGMQGGQQGMRSPSGQQAQAQQAGMQGQAQRITIVNEDCVEVEVMEAKMTAIGSVMTEELGATKSAIGKASVAHDASVSKSSVGFMSAETAVMQKGGVGIMKIDGDGELHQGGSSLIVAQRLNMDSSGAGAIMATKATAARSWIGLLAAGKVKLEDDSRVIVDMRAGLIIGAFLLGGMGILSAAMMRSRRGLMSRMNPLEHRGGMMGMRTGMMAGLMGMLGMRGGMMSRLMRAVGMRKTPMRRMADMAKVPAVTHAVSRMRHSV